MGREAVHVADVHGCDDRATGEIGNGDPLTTKPGEERFAALAALTTLYHET